MSDVTASGGPPPHTVLIQMGTAFWGSTSSRRRTSSTPELRDARAMAWQQLDRWIFVFMAAFILATVLVGFAPTSLGKIAAVEAGQRPPFPPVLHVHAVLKPGCCCSAPRPDSWPALA